MSAERKTEAIKILGGGLLIVGCTVMLSYLGLLGFQFSAFLDSSPTDLLGSCAGLGLASLRLVHYATFHDGMLFSVAHKILILFSALAATVLGLVMLRKRAARTTTR
jgi:hypothetical protein